jgi:predicted ester cyclase
MMSGMKARLAGAVERWNAGDLDGYLEIYDEDVRLHGYSPEPMGKDAVRAFYAMIYATFPAAGRPNPELRIDETIVEGPTLACRFVMSGVHRVAFMGVPATGRAIVLPGITMLRFRGDRVVERWSSADMLGLLVQLGALPPPA